jgi:glycosyltransferase involved in cell wall biosynthesis
VAVGREMPYICALLKHNPMPSFCRNSLSSYLVMRNQFPQGSSQPEQLRVLHVASGDSWAGAEVQIFQLVRAMARDSSLNLTIALLNDGELASRLRSCGFNPQIFDESRLSTLSIARALTGLCRRLRPHVVHTHRAKENLIGAAAAFLTPGALSLRTVHGAMEKPVIGVQLSRRLAGYLDRFAGRHLQAKVVAVSDELRSQLVPTYGADSVVSIWNGIDVNDVRAQSTAGGPTLPGSVRIGFVGRLTQVKRVDIFLRTARELMNRGMHKARFFVVGEGALRAKLESQAAALDLGSACDFLGFHSNCLPLMKQLDVLVLTSDHEGLPMAVLESLALGVPVVAHHVGGLPEVLDKPERGVLVRDHRPSAYADGIEEALRYRRPERDGADMLPQMFHISNCAQQYTQLYWSTVAQA